jgi:predicted DNA-binding transcriptional regulator YafY
LALALPVDDARSKNYLSALSRAIAERRTVRLKILLRSGEGAAVRRVDPYRLVPTGSGWDLLGYHHERERIVRMPLTRLQEVSVLQRRFRPLPVRILERIRLRCLPSHAQAFRARPPVGAISWEEWPDGSAVYTLAAFRAEDLLPWLLACGDGVEVLEPPALRQDVLRAARALCLRYAHQPTDSGPEVTGAGGRSVSLG